MIKIFSLQYSDDSLSTGESDFISPLNKKFEPDFPDVHGNTPNAKVAITALLGTTFASMGNAQTSPPALLPETQNMEVPYTYAGLVEKMEDSGFKPQLIGEDIDHDELIDRLDTLRPAIIHMVCVTSEPYVLDPLSGNKDAKAVNIAFYVDGKKFVYADVDQLIAERLSRMEKKIDTLKSAESDDLAGDIEKDILSDVIYDFIKAVFKFLIKLLTKDNITGILMTIALPRSFVNLVAKYIGIRRRLKKSDTKAHNPAKQKVDPKKPVRHRKVVKKRGSDATGGSRARSSKELESVHRELAKLGRTPFHPGTEKELTRIIDKLSRVLTEHFDS